MGYDDTQVDGDYRRVASCCAVNIDERIALTTNVEDNNRNICGTSLLISATK
jgi:hypothetical protein